MTDPVGWVVRRIRPFEAELLRAITIARFEHTEPGVFAGTLESALAATPSEWAERAADAAEGDVTAVFVAVLGGEAIGSATATLHDEPSEQAASVRGVYVDSACRGSGVGEALMQACLEWFAEVAPEREVVLWVSEGNRARGFYERLGFRPSGTRWQHPDIPERAWSELRL